MNYLKDLKTRELLAWQIIACTTLVMLFISTLLLISVKAEQDTGIRYIYTGTDYYIGDEFIQDQYFIRYIKNDNGDIQQLIFEASNELEEAEIKRYMREAN